MSELLLPRHQAVARAQQKRREANAPEVEFDPRTKALLDSITGGKDVAHDLDTPIPVGLPSPGLWRVAMMPMSMRHRSKGGIDFAPETIDTERWNHLLWRVCKVGPFCYRGPAWQGFTEEELAPIRAQLKPGALYLIDAKAPRRYYKNDTLIVVVNDDQLWSHVEPEDIPGLKFKGAELG